MTLFEQWREIAEQERSQQETEKFWQDYFDLETENYKKILSDPSHVYEGTVSELAKTFSMDETTFLGFLDGINTSLKAELKLEELQSESTVKLDIDLEKLYYNMLNAKADWLYNLPQWDGVLSEDARREITKKFRSSKVFVSEAKVGRNDPCPCGSGKKYKNCCGK
ncbi:MAG TPA: SEC-C metal-binding domain-containing protein [Clostridia bacterium]|nr:SEC-C metal-binding domain-containing protein [Clostridia bacterium]